MRKILAILVLALFVAPASAQNYSATAGSGLTFGAKLVGGVLYPQWVTCDPTTPANCAKVQAGNAAGTTDLAVTVADPNLLAGLTTLNTTAQAPVPVIAGTLPSTQTPVTTGTTTKAQSDLNGNLYVNQNLQSTLAGGSTFVSGTTAAMTGTAATQIVALVASKRLYINRIKCNNSSATATMVQITDGSAGTVLDTLAAGATYGGEQGTAPTPLFWTTAGNGLYAQDVTTGASVICTASGYSG